MDSVETLLLFGERYEWSSAIQVMMDHDSRLVCALDELYGKVDQHYADWFCHFYARIHGEEIYA